MRGSSGANVPDISSISTCVACSNSVILVLREASVTLKDSAISAGSREGCVACVVWEL